VVLSVDDKSQIQAPETVPKKGRAGTMTHDYKRHGTTTLFADLDFLEGYAAPSPPGVYPFLNATTTMRHRNISR
jgi:hypothetical protein